MEEPSSPSSQSEMIMSCEWVALMLAISRNRHGQSLAISGHQWQSAPINSDKAITISGNQRQPSPASA